MESLTEGGAVGAAAIKVVEELVLICKRVHRAKLRTIPPLPNWVKELAALNETLANERGKLAQHEQIELLIDSLGDESMTVRATALRELRSLLSTRREWALGLLGPGSGTTAGDRATRRPAAVERPPGRGGASAAGSSSGGSAATEGPQLLSRLMAALLRCCDPEVHNMVSQQAQQACAECLGMLGAVDPARLQVDPQPPASRCTSDVELLVTLISRHLVRLLKTAPSLQVLDAATLAIQELLKHYSRAEGLEALQQQATGAPGGPSGEAKGWGAASGQQREPTPAAVEGNLLFGALPAEVQVCWLGAL
jgi:serine/threonine-protein kinase ATR